MYLYCENREREKYILTFAPLTIIKFIELNVELFFYLSIIFFNSHHSFRKILKIIQK